MQSRQIEEIISEIRDLSPDERALYLSEKFAEDESALQEVIKLIQQHESSFKSLEEYNDSILGSLIGAYKIEREVGRGGMGAVYEAVRADGEFRHRVAIKVVKRGMDTDYILKRFRNERQILAALEHPNIAHLLGGGTTEDGRPYFLMEFIDGKPLYKYCDDKKLSIKERLKLFCEICNAVSYAHQKSIIHRDLKPSNILVSSNGVPTLLDFGIAKLFDTELEQITSPQTASAMQLMTVEYASPEQVIGDSVSLLSDVYSLGVILYELVTGHKPYRFANRMQHEIARTIVEDDPELPSIAITLSEQILPFSYKTENSFSVSQIAELRGDIVENLQNELSGNLNNITLKALSKEAAKRYSTVADLREDIKRHLKGEAISAPDYLTVSKKTFFTKEKSKAESSKVLAVLPLKYISFEMNDDSGENYLSIGLADAIITRLSNIKSFTVRPTSAIMRYGNENADPIKAGRELNVNYVLDGRIKRAGEIIRISLQLLDVKNSETIWAEQFDEKICDVLEFEDSISIKVTDALLPKLSTEEKLQLKKRTTNDPEAYKAYLRGRFFWNQFTPEILPKALEQFELAIALDPNYPLPYVGVADVYNWSCIYGILPPYECYPKAKASVLRAIELDENLGDAYATLGLIQQGKWEWEDAEMLYKKSLELNPKNANAHEWYATLLVGTGRSSEGVNKIQRAEELDPLSLRTMSMVAWAVYQSHHFSEAITKAEQIIDLDKNFPQGYLQLGNALVQTGSTEEAITAIQKCAELIPNSVLPHYLLCHALVAADRLEEAREVLNEMYAFAETNYVKPFYLAMAHVALNENDKAFELFEKSFEERDPWMVWFGTEPKLNAIHNDPRYRAILKRMNNPLASVENDQAKDLQIQSKKSLAVLPFKLTGERSTEDTGDEFLCIGLADTLITRLSNVHRIIVRPTSSILRFREVNADPFNAGQELCVNYIVDGNIRRVGKRIRVTAQLLNVNDSSTEWASQFDENFTDVLQLEDSISQQVAEALIPTLTGNELSKLKKRSTENQEAFEIYLRGRHYWNTFNAEGFAKALACYNRAIALDPDYSLVYTGIADYYNWLGVHGIAPFEECSATAKESAQKAIELDPLSAEAHSALGFAVVCHDFDWSTAKVHHERAIQLNPNYAIGHQWYGFHLQMEGNSVEAISEMNRSLEIDPFTQSSTQALCWCLYQSRRYEESLELHRKMLAIEPLYGYGYLTYSWVQKMLGLYEEAIAAATKAVDLSGETQFFLSSLGSAYAKAGKHVEAENVLNRLNEMSATSYVSNYHLALIHALLGNKENAFEQLEKAFEKRDGWLVWIYTEPQLDSLRDDPRFNELLKRINHPNATQ